MEPNIVSTLPKLKCRLYVHMKLPSTETLMDIMLCGRLWNPHAHAHNYVVLDSYNYSRYVHLHILNASITACV